tara:strand:+ start:91 stop:1575 length:1485 start_codon:yes stop_codon:yes gene_type:complete
MSDTDRAMVAEAKKILEGIRTHQRTSDQKLTQFEKQVEDLKKAQRLMQEAQTVVRDNAEHGNLDDRELKSFVEADGIRWKSRSVDVAVTGRGTIKTDVEGLLDSKQPVNQWHADLIKMNRDRSFARMLMSNPHTPQSDLKLWKHLQKAPRFMKPAIQKAFNDSAGVGAEWIPDQFASELYYNLEDQIQLPRVVADNMQRQQVERNTILVPRMSRGGRPYIKGSVTSDNPAQFTPSTISTSQKSITMTGLAARYVIDDQAAEDSAVLAIPTLQRQIVMDLNDAMEDALINGDTTATHQDDIANWNIRERWGTSPALGGSSDHRRAFVGLRAAAIDRSCTHDQNSATYTFANFLDARSQLGEIGMMDLICITSPEMIIKHLLGLDEVVTLEKFGPQATIRTGQLASLAGIPIIASRFMGADLAADGLYDNATKTKTGLLLVHTNSWRIFERRGILVESQRKIDVGATELVATRRATLDTLDLDATKNVCYQFDITS